MAVYIIYSGKIVLQCNTVRDLIVVIAGEEGFLIILEGAICEGLTDAVNSMDNEMLVVNAGEDFGSDFVSFE